METPKWKKDQQQKPGWTKMTDIKTGIVYVEKELDIKLKQRSCPPPPLVVPAKTNELQNSLVYDDAQKTWSWIRLYDCDGCDKETYPEQELKCDRCVSKGRRYCLNCKRAHYHNCASWI